MSKILLAAVNACYYHSNLAVRSIKEYCANKQIEFGEWSINQPIGEILRGISETTPEMIIFSTYIWNAEIITKIIENIKSILPDCTIGAGGPEFSYDAKNYLTKLQNLDFIIFGEGERTTKEIADCFLKLNEIDYKSIKGIYYRTEDKVEFSGERELMSDLSELEFPYPEITEPDNKIFYYESSRGCPFSCAYCLSSVDKRVRFMPLERVYSDLQRFLDANVKLVKFVDRTYNLNEERYISIWKYILENHNGKTMFHFEIEAEFLSQKALDFLQKVPKGVMQFEIGVQSSNKITLETVGRSSNIEKLAENIKQIPKTISCHLDLIAGLPFETLKEFGESFDYTLTLNPTELQLGFLKVLHGTKMEEYAINNNWKWMKNPPYETFSTPYLNWNDTLFLKDIEILVNGYWNSRLFEKSIEFIGRKIGFWKFFSNFRTLCKNKNVFEAPRKDLYWFDFIAENLSFFNDYLSEKEVQVLYELLRFDFLKTGKKGGFPSWYKHNYDKELHRAALENNGGIVNSRLDFAYSDIETFNINPMEKTPENSNETVKILFLYTHKGLKEKRDLQIIIKE